MIITRQDTEDVRHKCKVLSNSTVNIVYHANNILVNAIVHKKTQPYLNIKKLKSTYMSFFRGTDTWNKTHLLLHCFIL